MSIKHKNVDVEIIHAEKDGDVLIDIVSVLSHVSVCVTKTGIVVFTDQKTGERWIPSASSEEENI